MCVGECVCRGEGSEKLSWILTNDWREESNPIRWYHVPDALSAPPLESIPYKLCNCQSIQVVRRYMGSLWKIQCKNIPRDLLQGHYSSVKKRFINWWIRDSHVGKVGRPNSKTHIAMTVSLDGDSMNWWVTFFKLSRHLVIWISEF